MKTHTPVLIASLVLLAVHVTAQSVLFDFNNATQYSGLPQTLTVSGIAATFSATGQGFSIQSANALGFTPAGFDGLCIYPNSIYGADLIVNFSQSWMTNFSIMYAPEEYACDSSATMRVTAYSNGAFVATNTTTADPPGTWPTGTLTISTTAPFNSVVVHYDKGPVTGGDWGPVFLADNMIVTPSTATLTGTMGLAGVTNIPAGVPVTFTLFNGSTPIETETTMLGAGGTYSVGFNNTGGTDIWVKPAHHLSYRLPGGLSAGVNTVNWYCPYNGDANSDNTVNLLDLSTILGNFGKSGVPGIPGDLAYTGTVNLIDLSIVLANFGRTGQS